MQGGQGARVLGQVLRAQHLLVQGAQPVVRQLPPLLHPRAGAMAEEVGRDRLAPVAVVVRPRVAVPEEDLGQLVEAGGELRTALTLALTLTVHIGIDQQVRHNEAAGCTETVMA
ncbi:hypothetical protein ACH4TV_45335 [Streptomyces sp. NPDC020898]|uniref:hypothetical protein n=1 Tax=Streptomyces sp. NPDC020898 TaxID=3365101 RepID=UPI003793DDE0